MVEFSHMDSAFSKENKYNKYKEITFSSVELEVKEPESVLFYKGSKIRNFFTDDSGLYFESSDVTAKKLAEKEREKFFDSVNYRPEEIVNRYRKIRGSSEDVLYVKYQIFRRRLERSKRDVNVKSRSLIESVSLIRLWNTSMVAAVLIGMISMTAVYRYLGQGASADGVLNPSVVAEQTQDNGETWDKEKEDQYMQEIVGYLEEKEESRFEENAMEMVKGYPIENMMDYILGKDRDVAAFLIAIAKKESNWGKRVPVLNGEDCYNYWGYRGKRERMGTGGHTCFDSRKDAVDTVAKRIKDLIENYDRDTPAEMVVWKCGSDCNATGGQAAANKWISDVDMYMKKLSSTE